MEIKKSGWGLHFHTATGRCVRCTLPAREGGKRSDSCWSCSGFKPVRFFFFFSPPNSDRRRFRALRVRMIIEQTNKKKQNPSPSTCEPGSEDDGSDASSPLQTTRPSASSVFLHNSIIRFFYVDASCSENMEFLKGPRTPPCTCQRSPAVAAAAAAVAAASRSPRCG